MFVEFGRADPNIACVSYGMTLVDPPFSGGDYYALSGMGAPRRAG